MKKITVETKTLEEAKTSIVETLRVAENYIDFEVTEKKALLGLKRSYTVTGVVNVDIATYGQQLLETLFENMEIKATVNINENAEEISYQIETDENPVLIGKNGKTLEGLQFYMRNILNIFTEKHVMVLVDIGGYKENRKKQLEILATKTAKEVARTKISAKLEPMNAYERRIIHTKLSEWRDVSTTSEGNHPKRYLVIKPKKR